MIVAITGTPGAGKGTITDYLVQEKGFVHYSGSGFITEEVVRRGLPVDRNSMSEVANDLRKEHGPSYVIEQLFERASETSDMNAVIEALRAVAEAEFIQEKGAVLIAVDADQKVRYERIQGRKSEKDKVTFEEFQALEEKEQHSTDPNKQNVAGVMELADIRIDNNGTLEELRERLEKLFSNI